MELSEYSNSEIKIRIKSLENEFESVKSKISELCDRLNELDREYLACEAELKNRKIR